MAPAERPVGQPVAPGSARGAPLYSRAVRGRSGMSFAARPLVLFAQVWYTSFDGFVQKRFTIESAVDVWARKGSTALMRAVAVALVLIAGAAVILWYGNTLNSLVLGGLIGGLAALLLSIPISLTIFSYLARRHDDRLRAELYEQEQMHMTLAQRHEYSARAERVVDVYEEEDAYIPVDEEEWLPEEEYDRRPRRLPPPAEPAPYSQRRLPAAREQGYESPYKQLPAPASRAYDSYESTESMRSTQVGRQVPGPTQTQGKSGRRPAHPGFPGYQAGSFRSQYQSQALRAARREAAQQFEDETIQERRPARRPSAPRREEFPGDYDDAPAAPRASRRLPSQMDQGRRTRDFEQDDPPTQLRSVRRSRPLQQENEHTTDYINRSFDPQTDYIDSDALTGESNRALQRRAPYMYEDDALRQELAQHFDGPITRRSSRQLSRHHDDE